MASKPTWRSALLACLIASHFTLAQAASPVDLFKAADAGNTAQVNALIAQGVPVDSADPDGWTPLMVAAAAGKLPAVQALVKAGADVNARSKRGETPLIAAALSGNAAIVKLLLSEGADKTATSAQGLTAADVAKKAKHESLVKLLAVPASPASVPAGKVSSKGLEARVNAAADAFKAGSYTEAARLFREVTQADPKHALAWHFLGQSLAKTGDNNGARAAYKKVLEVQPDGQVAERTRTLVAQLPGEAFKDCPDCPEMITLPAGSFDMGSPSYEKGRDDDEGPVHRVTIKPFAMGKTHVTRGQFSAFVTATGYDAGDRCFTFETGEWKERSGRNWRNPGFAQDDSHPAVCINWHDAKAYAEWLARKTGKAYRLPSESEMEYAIRGGTNTVRWWGDNPDDACANANVADQTVQAQIVGASDWTVHACSDGHAYTTPVASFKANGFGLHDMIGNAWQWNEDCWNGHYNGAPGDGSAWASGDCAKRALRGGSWFNNPHYARAAERNRNDPTYRDNRFGFRVARILP